jgi:hypothetical protein
MPNRSLFRDSLKRFPTLETIYEDEEEELPKTWEVAWEHWHNTNEWGQWSDIEEPYTKPYIREPTSPPPEI